MNETEERCRSRLDTPDGPDITMGRVDVEALLLLLLDEAILTAQMLRVEAGRVEKRGFPSESCRRVTAMTVRAGVHDRDMHRRVDSKSPVDTCIHHNALFDMHAV